jgi:hypothetical protein
LTASLRHNLVENSVPESRRSQQANAAIFLVFRDFDEPTLLQQPAGSAGLIIFQTGLTPKCPFRIRALLSAGHSFDSSLQRIERKVGHSLTANFRKSDQQKKIA